MGLVIDTLEKPPLDTAISKNPAHGAATERDVPLVSIPCPTPIPMPVPRHLALSVTRVRLCPPSSGCAPRTGGLLDGAVRQTTLRRGDVHGSSAFDAHADRGRHTLTAQHLCTSRTTRTQRPPRTRLR